MENKPPFSLRKNQYISSIFVVVLLFISSSVFAATRTSVASGDWTVASTWDCNCVPNGGDDIVIASGTVVVLNGNETMNNLTVAAGGTLDNNRDDITLDGNLHVDGDILDKGDIFMDGVGTTISGVGSLPDVNNIEINNGDQTILPGTTLSLLGADFNINGAFTVLNQGEITIRGRIDGSNNLSWVNDVNSILNLGKEVRSGTITASATGNTVNYYRAKNQDIVVPVGGSYYNLTAGGGSTKTLLGPISVIGDLTIESAELDLNGSDISVGGNWTNTYGTFLPGTQIVTLNGSGTQIIGGSGPETFYDLVVNKAAGEVVLGVGANATNSLSMTSGNINTGTSTLSLGTSLANPGAFNYTAGTIVGKFERWLTTTATPYNFPIGTSTNPRDASITFNNLVGGTVTLEFIESFPTNNGVPLLDVADSVFNTFSEGYWSLVASNGLSSTDYNINLDGNGLSSYGINGSTRILTRPNTASNWTANGSHVATVGTVATRNNVTTLNAQFAFGDTTSCYGAPLALSIVGLDSVCAGVVGESYSVVNNPGSTYTWTIVGGTQSSGGTTNSITVDWSAVGQVGSVTVQEYAGCRFGNPTVLSVSIHSIAPSSVSGPISAAQNSSGYTYSVVSELGYSYNWIISGGTIDFGNGTDTIGVSWGAFGTGTLSVEASTGCGVSASQVINVKIYETINSIASGNWSNTGTWDCGCIPGLSNNVYINTGHTVTLTGRIDVNHLIIDQGGVLDDAGNRSRIYGDLILNGAFAGNNRIELRGTNSTLDGTGSFGTHTGELRFRDGIKTIASTAVLNNSFGFVNVRGSTLVKNLGHFTVVGDILGRDPATSIWVNEVNSTLIAGGAVMDPNTLIASATGNTVEYNGTAAQNVTIAQNNQYYNLTISGAGGATLQSLTDIDGNVNISSTFLSAGFNINLAGDWTNTGTFTHGSNLITFDGVIEQNVYNTIGEAFFDVTINSGSYVTVPSTSIVTVRNILANSGTLNNNGLTQFTLGYENQIGVLRGNGTHELSGGNWINSGTFIQDSSTVKFSNTAAQTIQGPTTFYNLTSVNAAGVTILADAQDIKNTMTVSAGTFNTTNLLSLVSDATLTGRIAEIPAGADVLGNVTVNRYIAPAPTSWRFLSTACAGQTLANWVDDFAMSGFPGAYPNFSFTSVFRYIETFTGDKDTLPSFVAPTSINDPILINEAYWVYVGPVALTFEVTGVINKFAQSMNVSYTPTGAGDPVNDGWCLVSNPYPSEIDWDAAAGWTKTNINNAIYVWNPVNQQYTSYVAGIGTNGGSRYVSSQQGFYVQTNAAAPALSMTEAVKAFGNPSYYKSSNNYAVDNLLKLQITGNSQFDEIVIRFDDNATSNFDQSIDAIKFQSLDTGIVTFSSVSGLLDYSINTVPSLTNDVSIPLRVVVGTSGNYTINMSDISGMPIGSCFMLEDLFTGTITDLETDSSYTYNASDTTTIARFLLHIGAPIGKEITDVSCNAGSDGFIIAKGNGTGPWNYIWYDSNDSIIKQSVNLLTSDTLADYSAGSYKLKIGGNTGVCGSQMETIYIAEPLELNLDLDVVNNSCFKSNDGSISTVISGGVGTYTYNWSTGETGSNISQLPEGKYTLTIEDENACEKSDTIIVSEPDMMDVSIIVESPSSNENDGSVTFDVQGGTPNYSYQWNSVTQSVSTIHGVRSGYYTYVIIDDNGCQVMDSLFVKGMYLENEAANGIGIFPNPVVDFTTIEFEVKEKQDVEIRIYNVLGDIVFNKGIKQAEGLFTEKINMTNLASGIYEIEVQIGEETRNEKLMVQ